MLRLVIVFSLQLITVKYFFTKLGKYYKASDNTLRTRITILTTLLNELCPLLGLSMKIVFAV